MLNPIRCVFCSNIFFVSLESNCVDFVFLAFIFHDLQCHFMFEGKLSKWYVTRGRIKKIQADIFSTNISHRWIHNESTESEVLSTVRNGFYLCTLHKGNGKQQKTETNRNETKAEQNLSVKTKAKGMQKVYFLKYYLLRQRSLITWCMNLRFCHVENRIRCCFLFSNILSLEHWTFRVE